MLAVQDRTRGTGYDFDRNDCWAISGIFRDVILFSTPQCYFKVTQSKPRSTRMAARNCIFRMPWREA